MTGLVRARDLRVEAVAPSPGVTSVPPWLGVDPCPPAMVVSVTEWEQLPGVPEWKSALVASGKVCLVAG